MTNNPTGKGERKEFKLVGLNKGWKAAGFPGMYGTFELLHTDRDWWHFHIAESIQPGLWEFCDKDWKDIKENYVAIVEFKEGEQHGTMIELKTKTHD